MKSTETEHKPARPSRNPLRRAWDDFASGRRLRHLRTEYLEKGTVAGLTQLVDVRYREGHDYPWEIVRQEIERSSDCSWKASWTMQVKEMDEFLYSAYIKDIGKAGEVPSVLEEGLGLKRRH